MKLGVVAYVPLDTFSWHLTWDILIVGSDKFIEKLFYVLSLLSPCAFSLKVVTVHSNANLQANSAFKAREIKKNDPSLHSTPSGPSSLALIDFYGD